MIDHVAELMDAGLDSLKIEGRAKSAYYAAIVTGAYRHAVDAAKEGKPLDPRWRQEVERVSHRHYSTGFYYGYPGQYTDDARYIRDWQVCAIVQSCDETGLATLSLRNKFSVGDQVEVVGPNCLPQAFPVTHMEDETGPLDSARKPQSIFKMQLPCQVPPLSIIRRQVDLSPK
jgi:putative protease